MIERLRSFAEYEADLADESKWERIEWEAADLIESQAAALASLQETLDAVAKVASDVEKLVISQRDEIATLTAKLEAAEQDAARYRFLKLGRSCDIELMELNEEDGEYYGVCLIKGDYIDNTIDADMTKME